MLVIDTDVGRCRVVGRPHVDDRSLFTQLLQAYVENVNLRPAGPVEENGGSSVENDRECVVESQHLKSCSPAYVS
jgi:hypothetical protein